jgi:hypothetical protein
VFSESTLSFYTASVQMASQNHVPVPSIKHNCRAQELHCKDRKKKGFISRAGDLWGREAA